LRAQLPLVPVRSGSDDGKMKLIRSKKGDGPDTSAKKMINH
jgi:hypothetical protein